MNRRSPNTQNKAKAPTRKAASSRPFLGAAVLSDTAWVEIARSLELSGRELEIARGMFDNLTDAAIAGNLNISGHTIHIHSNRLFKKLRVTTRVQLVLRVMQELLFLTVSDDSCLPSICRNRANGRCPLLENRHAGL